MHACVRPPPCCSAVWSRWLRAGHVDSLRLGRPLAGELPHRVRRVITLHVVVVRLDRFGTDARPCMLHDTDGDVAALVVAGGRTVRLGDALAAAGALTHCDASHLRLTIPRMVMTVMGQGASSLHRAACRCRPSCAHLTTGAFGVVAPHRHRRRLASGGALTHE